MLNVASDSNPFIFPNVYSATFMFYLYCYSLVTNRAGFVLVKKICENSHRRPHRKSAWIRSVYVSTFRPITVVAGSPPLLPSSSKNVHHGGWQRICMSISSSDRLLGDRYRLHVLTNTLTVLVNIFHFHFQLDIQIEFAYHIKYTFHYCLLKPWKMSMTQYSNWNHLHVYLIKYISHVS